MDPVVPKPPVKPAKGAARSAIDAATTPQLPRIKPTGKKPAPVAKPASVAKPAPAIQPPVTADIALPVVKEPAVPAALAAPAPAPAPAPTVAAPATPTPSIPPIAAAPVQAPVPVTPTAAKEVIMETIENVTAKTQTVFADATERAKGAVEKSQKLFEDANEFGKGNIEALVESSKIAARGFEALGQDAANYAKKSFEEATAAAKTLSSVKSPTEFLKLQSDYARSAFDALVQQTSHNTETLLKLAGEVAQPLSNRVALAAEKMKVVA